MYPDVEEPIPFNGFQSRTMLDHTQVIPNHGEREKGVVHSLRHRRHSCPTVLNLEKGEGGGGGGGGEV